MMNNFNIPGLLVLSVFCSILFQRCEEVPEFDRNNQVPVVEAYLYANAAVDDISVSSVVPFGFSGEEISLSGLDLSITYDGTAYPLSENKQMPGTYFYQGEGLAIRSGESYTLSFEYNGRNVTSQTSIPFPPEDLRLSVDEIFLPQLLERSDIRDLIRSNINDVLIEWDNPDGDYFFVTVENVAADPEPIDLNNILDFNFQFISRPTQNDFFTLRPLAQFTQFGTHRIIVYRVNEEYAVLYETLEQDSRDLNEPFSNITNGVGIFSGFASDTLLLEVSKQ